MNYLVLLHGDEATANEPGTPEFDAEIAGYAAFGEVAGDAIVAGEALEPTATARTVRPGTDGPLVTAGPFAEITEALGGYYVLEADTLDDVLELVRHIPAVREGGVEVRPMVEWVDRSDGAAGPVTPPERRWLCTIHGTATDADDPAHPAWADGAAEHEAFGADAGEAVLAAGAVRPADTATTVKERAGDLLVTDGPFAEATEIVGGFYLLRATDDEIVALAARIPVGPGGGIEIRPIMELDG